MARHLAEEAGRGDLRDRRSAQPRRGADRLAGRAGTSGRVKPSCGKTRQGVHGLRLSAQLSGCWRGAAANRLLEAPTRTGVRAGAESGRMRVPDGRPGGRGRTPGGTFASALATRSSAPLSRACALTSTRLSIRATARSRSVSIACGMSASTCHRIRPRWRRDANMSASGRSSAAATIEELVDLPLMTDPESLATLDVLTKVSPPSTVHRWEPQLPGHMQSGQP